MKPDRKRLDPIAYWLVRATEYTAKRKYVQAMLDRDDECEQAFWWKVAQRVDRMCADAEKGRVPR